LLKKIHSDSQSIFFYNKKNLAYFNHRKFIERKLNNLFLFYSLRATRIPIQGELMNLAKPVKECSQSIKSVAKKGSMFRMDKSGEVFN
jgi:hypothetical protein